MTKNYTGLIEKLNREMNAPITLTKLWEMKDELYGIPEEVLCENPSAAVCMIKVLVMEGKLEEAERYLKFTYKDPLMYDWGQIILPTVDRNRFRRVVERRMRESGQRIPKLILTAGRPSVLNGFRDFTEYGKYIKQLKDPIVRACQVLYGDAATGVYEIALAEHLYWRNKCFEALVLVVGTIPFMENLKDVRCLFAALTLEIFILVANGQTAAVEPLIANLRRRVEQYGSEELEQNLTALGIWAAMYDGKTEQINRWMKEKAPDEHSGFSMLDTFCYMIKFRCYLIQEKHMALLSTAERIKPLLEKGHRWMDLCEMMMIQAMSFHAQGRKEQAYELLDKVLHYSKRYGYDRLIGDEGSRMYKLLYEYRRDRGSDPYLTRVMDIARKMGLLYPDYLRASYETVQKMTGMELDVLRLMTEEKSNGEIGEYLDISTNTVKFHVKNIYRKLKVSSRGQAVKKAKEAGIL